MLFILILGVLAGSSGCRSGTAPQELFADAELLRLEYEVDASQQAIVRYRDAVTMWTRQGDYQAAARASQGIGYTYERLGRLEESLTSHTDALALSQLSRDPLLESRIRSDVGVAHARLGDLDRAAQQCQAALKSARGFGGTWEEARALYCLGEVDYHQGDSANALKSYRAAETLWRRLDDRRELAETLLLIASSQADVNELDSARQGLENALSLWRDVGDERGQVLTHAALARLHFILGEYQQALDSYTALSERFRIAGDTVWEAACLSNLAYVYERMGDGSSALRHWEQASRLFETAGLQMAALEMSIKIGTGYLAEDATTALGWFEKARTLSEASGNRHMQSWALRYAGLAHLADGYPAKALGYFEQSLETQRSIQDPRFRSQTLADTGTVHALLGHPAAAFEYLNQALELSDAYGYRVGQAVALFGLARASAGLDDLDAGREYIERALTVAESLRTEVESRDLRASYVASVYEYHELHMDVLMRLDGLHQGDGLAAAAFEASERARARSLLESLTEAEVDLRAGVDATLLKREQSAKKAFDDWASRRAATESGDQAEAMVEEYRDLEESYDKIESEIRSNSPHYAALVQPQPLSLAEVQAQVLDAGTILLEYALGDERSYLWAVSATGQSSYTLPPRAEIEAVARHAHELLTMRMTAEGDRADVQRRAREADAEYWTEAARLSEMLLGPVAEQLAGQRILVVADGALQYLPFAALPVPGRHDAPVPMVVEHEIVHLPSASVLAVVRRETANREMPAGSVAVLADPVFEADDPRLRGKVAASPKPKSSSGAFGFLRDDVAGARRLPMTSQEAAAIVAAAPEGTAWRADAFDASRATAMSPELAKYRIVHFATHGVFDNESPGRSGVLLSTFDAEGNQQDGFLRLRDIYGLRLPAELVVLSACNTALGKQVRGEGLVGLVRGFMYAGAKRVVASLWKVDDEATGELMTSFYRHMLQEQRSPAAALREAQLELWRQDRWQPPFYWAAFVLQGEWR